MALSPDGKRYAYLYHIMRYRRPSGISKFPDGGVSLYLEDRVMLILCEAKGHDMGGGPSIRNNCTQSYVVQELPFKYKPRRTHMSIGHARLQWMTPYRIAYDMQSLSVVSDKGEVEIPRQGTE